MTDEDKRELQADVEGMLFDCRVTVLDTIRGSVAVAGCSGGASQQPALEACRGGREYESRTISPNPGR